MADDPGAALRLQPLARARIAGLGEVGTRWAVGLPALLDDLEQRWDLRIGRRSLPGGSNGIVLPATTTDGADRVVKVAAPDVDLGRQAAVLRAAGGRGHVRLHAHDPDRRALLLDRLGRSLAQAPGPVEDALDVVAATLQEAWDAVPVHGPGPGAPAGGPAQAHRVTDRLERLAGRLREVAAGPGTDLPDLPDLPVLVERARACAARRAASREDEADVVCHGDAHPANLLRAPGSATGWLLVDAEGPRAPASYDVGVVLRDWSSHLQDPATAPGLLRRWCARAAAATGTDPVAVAEWAFAERVVTGLHLVDIGAPRVGRPLLAAAAALVAGGGPGAAAGVAAIT